jgi:hypothetical protein
MMHIKMIFSFLPRTDKHIAGNTLHSSDNSVMQLIQLLHFFVTCLYKPAEERIQNSQIWLMRGARKWVSLFLSNDEEVPCPKRHEYSLRSEVVHQLTGKLLPQGRDTK